MFPGLVDNSVWAAVWESHGALSLSASACRPSARYNRMAELESWAKEENFIKASGLQVQDFTWSQTTADPARVAHGRGTSACSFLQVRMGIEALLDGTLPEPDRASIAKLAEEYDTSGRHAGGSVPESELKHFIASQKDIQFRVVEGNVGNDGRLQCGAAGQELQVASEEELALALHATVVQHQGPVFVVLANAKCAGSTDGNASGLFIGYQAIRFTDTHGRKDVDGEDMGMVTASLDRSPRLLEDLKTVSRWLHMFHRRKVGTVPPYTMVSASVCWAVETVGRALLYDETWAKVLAMKPLLPYMLPGDFIIDEFGGSHLLQLCAGGMKLQPTQKHLLKMFVKGAEKLGADEKFDEDLSAIVSWLLDAFCDAPSVDEAVAAHGTPSHCTGPTAFLKQLGIVTTKPPYASAPPLLAATEQCYYLTPKPTVILGQLRAALEHTNVEINSGADYIQVQTDLVCMLAGIMLGVSDNYVAPYLAKKLTYLWVGERIVDYSSVAVRTMMPATADQRGGLTGLLGGVPAGVLGEILGVPPSLGAMYYCLLAKVQESAEWITQNVTQMRQCLDSFVENYGFPPSPAQLAAMVVSPGDCLFVHLSLLAVYQVTL